MGVEDYTHTILANGSSGLHTSYAILYVC